MTKRKLHLEFGLKLFFVFFLSAGLLAVTYAVERLNKIPQNTEAATNCPAITDSVTCNKTVGCSYQVKDCAPLGNAACKATPGCKLETYTQDCRTIRTKDLCGQKKSCTWGKGAGCIANIAGHGSYCSGFFSQTQCNNAGSVLGVKKCSWITNKTQCNGTYVAGQQCNGVYSQCQSCQQINCTPTCNPNFPNQIFVCSPNRCSKIGQLCPSGKRCVVDAYTKAASCK